MDIAAVEKEFIWGKVDPPKIVHGGLRWHSGLIIPELGIFPCMEAVGP